VHLYDLTKLKNIVGEPNLPAYSIDLKCKQEHDSVFNISLLMQPGFEAILSLSLGKSLCLYDLRQGSKIMNSSEIQALKTKFYPSNPNYLAVLTHQGTLELFDQRNLGGGPVQIYNEEYQKEKISREIDNEKERIEMKNRELLKA